jgi:hypothetical protein
MKANKMEHRTSRSPSENSILMLWIVVAHSFQNTGAMYANDRNRDGSGRQQMATLFKPRNGGGLATSRYNI